MKTVLPLLLAALAATSVAAAQPPSLARLNPADLTRRLEGDQQAVTTYRRGLQSVIAWADKRADLFPTEKPKESALLTREQKEAVWTGWKTFLDYLVALDGIEKFHREFYKLKSEPREEAFVIAHAAHAAKYRHALELIHRTESSPSLHTLLNEPVPELGLPDGTYARLKFQYLNVLEAGEFAVWESASKLIGGQRAPDLRTAIREDSARILDFGKGRGEALTVQNGLRLLQTTGFKAWFPIQANASEWMGDTKVHRKGVALISPAQIQALVQKLEPGDVLVTRSEWFLSNIGLPGFWPHGALFIGTPEQRKRYFDEPGARSWVSAQGYASGDFEAFLMSRYPAAAQASAQFQEGGHAVRILEAISEGVSFSTLEHTAGCDSFAALRPRLAKRDKAAAILRAFHFAGRPYDFNFDFQTDSALVCTELVWKSYEPRPQCRGLKLPIVDLMGHLVMPANEMVRQFDAQFGTPEQQFDLVVFLDGHERGRKAVESDVAAFRESWKRPKWHILTQGKK